MGENGSSELVVVTGGAGFIGSHTVGALLGRGHRVVVLDDFSSGKRENLAAWRDESRLVVIDANVVDGLWPPLTGVVASHGPVDRIIHLAAQTAVISSIENPLDDVRRNYAATVHVLEYARYSAVKKVVFASSAAVYGDVDTFPVSETARCRPVSPYGIDKLGSENYLAYYADVHGVWTTPLRFFNVYGPRQDPKSAYSGVISKFFDRAIQNEELLIFGDGKQTRDFVYVGDVANAIVRATFQDSGAGEPVNVGTGVEVSVNELANLVVESVGSASAVRHVEARAGEIVRSLADISRARELLGYVPTLTMAEGLAKTAAWFAA